MAGLNGVPLIGNLNYTGIMRRILTLLVGGLLLAVAASPQDAERKHYVGGDISLLPEYENAGAKYKTHEGEPIDELLPWLYKQGMNAMRVRLFVNPADYTEPDTDPNACQTLEYILPLCQRIKEQGMALMLDFHYSDTWADPAKQWIPKAWEGLSDDELYVKIYDYTKECLARLNEAGATPDFIQTGNEISYGMLWGRPGDKESDLKKTYINSPDANWQRLGHLLREAIKACREECPEAKIVIHTERAGDNTVLKNFYQKMDELKVDYDIIGLSYYPYFHGKMSKLNSSLTLLEKTWPEREVMIVETGYSYKWEVPGATEKVEYPLSDAGQNEFATALVETLEKHPTVTGLFWWWMEYNAFGTTMGNWYNAPLFDSRTGKACSALTTICSFAKDDSGVTALEAETLLGETPLYDLQGRPIAHPRPGEAYITANRQIRIDRE